MQASKVAGLASRANLTGLYYGPSRIAKLWDSASERLTRTQYAQRSAALSQAAKQHYFVTPVADRQFAMRLDVQNYFNHRFRCINSPKEVDNSAPKIQNPAIPAPALYRSAVRNDIITQENKMLLEKINTIWRTKATTDTCPPTGHYATNRRKRIWDGVRTEAENVGLLYRIQKTGSGVPSRESCAQHWKWNVDKMRFMTRFPIYFIRDEQVQPLPMKNAPPVDPKEPPRKRVFMEFITSQQRFLGQIEIELFEKEAPLAVANFLAYIRGDSGQTEKPPTPPSGAKRRTRGGRKKERPLCYRETPLHRILPGFYCLGGDVTNRNGTGGASIHGGPSFPAEKNELELIEPGLLCTVGSAEDTNDSKFMITMKAMPAVNGTGTVFGRVLKGFEVLWAIDSNGATSGKPINDVFCCDCGEIVPRRKTPRSRGSRVQKSAEQDSAASTPRQRTRRKAKRSPAGDCD